MSKQLSSNKVPADRVVPVDTLSDRKSLHGVILAVLFRFDDVLDPEKLRGSLEQLLGRDDWRRVGARLRLNDKGRLDYHIPSEFSDSRPALAYSHVRHDCTMAEHPLAGRLPRAAAEPTVLTGPVRGMFDSLMQRAGGPRVLKDYLDSDEPMLGLHIVSFADGTLVSLKWHHVFSDVVGVAALLDVWTLVLRGRGHEVPPLHGGGTAPTAHASSAERYRFADREISSRWGACTFFFRHVWELWRHPGESGLVCIPAQLLKDMREEALRELVRLGAARGAGPFVSEGDVVAAALIRLGLSHLPCESAQEVQINIPFSFRHVYAQHHLPAGKAVVANAVARMYSYARVRDILHQPLGWTAALIRRSIADLGTRGQVEAQLALERDAIERTGQRPLYGSAWMRTMSVSNWSKAALFDKDFSAAVAKTGRQDEQDDEGEGRSAPRGRPSLVVPSAMLPGGLLSAYRDLFYIIGKDARGNVWVLGYVREGVLGRIEKGLRQGGRLGGLVSSSWADGWAEIAVVLFLACLWILTNF